MQFVLPEIPDWDQKTKFPPLAPARPGHPPVFEDPQEAVSNSLLGPESRCHQGVFVGGAVSDNNLLYGWTEWIRHCPNV